MSRRAWIVACGLGCLALLGGGGCSRETSVGHDFPVPVMDRLPHRVGLMLDEALRTHAVDDVDEDEDPWHVELGAAHASLFRQLFAGMFRETVEVDRPSSSGGLAATFRPEVEDYQFSTPEQSHSDYTEAWVRYRMVVYGPRGEVAATWPFSGYGRSEGSTLRPSGSLDDATGRALRDAGAVVVLKLTKQPAIRALLERDRSAPGGGR